MTLSAHNDTITSIRQALELARVGGVVWYVSATPARSVAHFEFAKRVCPDAFVNEQLLAIRYGLGEVRFTAEIDA